MSDITISSAGVTSANGTVILDNIGVAGEAFNAGEVLQKKTDGLYYKAKSDTANNSKAVGVAMNSALAAGQPVEVAKGIINYGGVTGVTVGGVYVASGTAGHIAPVADLASGAYVTIVGVGVTTTQLNIAPTVSGVAVP